MAHKLASRRKLTLEFFPTPNENEAVNSLNAGVCDIYMRSLPISEGRTLLFAMTVRVYTSSLGLIVKDHRRDEFSEWKALHAVDDTLKIGVDVAEDSIAFITEILPQATLLPIWDMTEQDKMLASVAKGIDAIADMAEEGAAWTVLYPSFNVVVPQPTISIPVSYAVAKGNSDLLNAVNA